MRSYRKTIILLVFVGILAGVYSFLSNKKTDIKPEEAAKTEKIFEIDTNKMSEVVIENKDGKFVLTKNDKDWAVISPANFKADKTKIDSIISNISFLTAEKIIDENASDLNQFGFNNPVEISIKHEGGIEQLEVGNLTPTKDAYYVKEKGKNKVYTVSSGVGAIIIASKNDIRDKSIYTAKAEEITGISLIKGGNLIFTAKKSPETEWEMTAPISVMANSIQMDNIIQAVAKNSAYINLIEEKPADIGKYDLKNPPYSIQLDTAAGNVKLLIGAEKEKGKELYAKLSDKDEVFTIDEASMNFLDKPFAEISGGNIYDVSFQDVSKVVVEMDGKTTVSELETNKEDSSKNKYTVNNKDANMKDDKDNSLFMKYFNALTSVALDEIDLNSKPAAKPEITFTYALKNAPGTMKIEFIPKDQNYYYVVKNGKNANVMVKKSSFDSPDGVRQTQQKLLEAINK